MPFAQREGNLPGKVRWMTEERPGDPAEEIQALTIACPTMAAEGISGPSFNGDCHPWHIWLDMAGFMADAPNTKTLIIEPEMLDIIAELDEFKGAWRALGTLAPEPLSSLRHVATIESIGSSTHTWCPRNHSCSPVVISRLNRSLLSCIDRLLCFTMNGKRL
jgi:hypothetical protein